MKVTDLVTGQRLGAAGQVAPLYFNSYVNVFLVTDLVTHV
jgi:hypothetical protein